MPLHSAAASRHTIVVVTQAGSSLFNLISIVAALAAFFIIDPGTSLPFLVLAVSISVIVFIVLGEKSELEEKWESRGLPGREALAPLAALFAFMFHPQLADTFNVSLLGQVIYEKAPILILILSFAVVSNGLSKCGFFEYAAYKAVEKCDGETKRLILYIFIIASIITLVTSNDIVVLTLTPIIYAVCINAKIRNGKLFFLSQFVAANTLAMGLMIGSPTNIIIAQEFGIDFLEYLFLMIVPAIFAFLLSIIVVDFINRRSLRTQQERGFFRRLNWEYFERYNIPARAPWSEFTSRMGRWLWLFAGAVILLMIVTGQSEDEQALYLVAIPLIAGSAILQLFEVVADDSYRHETTRKRATDFASTLLNLPYGILFFATVFFMFSKVVVEYGAMDQLLDNYFLLSQQNPLLAGPATVFGSGITVNVINDLPAAALLGETLQCGLHSSAVDCANYAGPNLGNDRFTRDIIISSLLVGLNIGCYLTPVGALAGLIWFNQMRVEERRQEAFHEARRKDPRFTGELGKFEPVILPTRVDLVIYGSLNFAFVGLLLGLFIPFSALLLQIMAYPTADLSNVFNTIAVPGLGLTIIAGLIVIGFIIVRTKRVISRNQVALSHMSEIFTLLNSLTIWSFKHRILYIISILIGFVSVAATILYWAEASSIHTFTEVYTDRLGIDPSSLTCEPGMSRCPLDTSNRIDFFAWFFVFFGSSYEQLMFPQSLLGQVIAGIVPLSAIAAVLYVVKSTSTESLEKLRLALGEGRIPNYRILIVNHQAKFEQSVIRMLEKRGSFVVLICRDEHMQRTETFADSLLDEPGKANRVLVRPISIDPYATLKDLDFANAGEIFFLTDLKSSTDIDNMRMLTRIDAWLNSQRVSAANDLTARNYLPDDRESLGALTSMGDFVKIPKMYYEASSKRQLERIRSSLSDLTRYHTHGTSFDDVVSDQIFSDVFGDLEQLNDRLGFGIPMHSNPELSTRLANSMFKKGRAPFLDYQIVDRPASSDLIGAVRKLFSDHAKAESERNRSIKNHSVDVRIQLQEMIADARHPDGTKLGTKNSIIGVTASIDKRALRMTSANAAVSCQAETTRSLLELKRDVARQEVSKAVDRQRPQRQRLVLFNFNPYTDTFVRELIRSNKLDAVETIIMVNKWTNIPDDISTSSDIKIFRRDTVDEAIGLMVPFELNPNQTGSKERPKGFEDFEGIRSGDSVVVFTDYEDEINSNVEVVQFIEGLDFRMNDGGMQGVGARHRDLFLAVECNNEETRFLFEHLAVDKVLDTSRLRRSYLEHLAETFHAFPKRMKDRDFAGISGETRYGQYHPTMFNFKRSLRYAEYFKPFVVRMADVFMIVDQDGLEVSAVGMKCSMVHDLLERYSEPPLFLISVARLAPRQYRKDEEQEYGSGPFMEVMDFDPEYTIHKHDVLILCPLV